MVLTASVLRSSLASSVHGGRLAALLAAVERRERADDPPALLGEPAPNESLQTRPASIRKMAAAHATPLEPDHPAFRSVGLTDEELRFFKAEGYVVARHCATAGQLARARGATWQALDGEKEIRVSEGSLEPRGPLPMHLHTVYTEYSECVPAYPIVPPG
jgi:hypothetical protein